MNRRRFLGSLAAVAVAPLLPVPYTGVDLGASVDRTVPIKIDQHYTVDSRVRVGKTISVRLPQRYTIAADNTMK